MKSSKQDIKAMSDEPEIYTGKGGKRPNAGRPKGAKTAGGVNATHHLGSKKAEAILELAEARAKKESYLAHLAEIDYQQKRGDLIAIETVFRVVETASTACREHLLGISGRYASMFAAEADAKVIEQTLDKEIRRALEHITNVANYDFSTTQGYGGN